MTESQPDAVLHEKILYRYTNAVERGDFATISAILAQAEGDPQLEQKILEINAALIAELPPAPHTPVHPQDSVWQKIKAVLRTVAPGVGVSVVVLMAVFVVQALFIAPAIGNIFSNVMHNAPTSDGSRYGNASMATVMPYQQGSIYSEAYPAFAPTEPAFTEADRAAGYPAPDEFGAMLATPTPFVASASGAAINSGTAATPGQPRMIAHTGYLAMTVADTRKSRDIVHEVISSYTGEGAFILSSSEQGIQGSDQPSIFMQLRVPVARYDEVMNRLIELALSINVRQEQASDVTTEYVDTQARIRELETAINRLLEIAKTAQNTQELLTVEKALSDRRAEMEAMKGRAQFLSQTAALSLIQLELQPKIVYPTVAPTPSPTPEAWRPQETAQHSASIFLRDLRRFGDWLIVFGITTLPWIIIMGLVGIFGYRMWRKIKK